MKKAAALLMFGSMLCAQTPTPKTEPKPPQAASAEFDALAQKAEAARNSNDTVQAQQLYERALRLKPTWPDGWWYLGSLRYDADQYPQAREAFRKLTQLTPKLAVGWAMLGLCDFETKNYDESLAHLERAQRMGLAQDEGFYSVATYHYVLLLSRSEQFDSATSIISKIAAHETAGPKWVEAMGIAALHKPVLPSELPPTERELVMNTGRAMCDAAARQTADATAELSYLRTQYPKQPQLSYLYGTVLLVSDPEKALEAFKDELRLSPGHAGALINLASEYLKEKDPKSALPFAERAVASNPRSFAAHAMLGQVLTEGELDMPRGIRELESAAKLEPSSLQTHFSLAQAYAKAGRKEDAAKERAEFMRLRAAVNAPAEVAK
jgi:tetratricopeptide (TPR) repeat protein